MDIKELKLPSNLSYESNTKQRQALERWGEEQGLTKKQIESWYLSGENKHSYYYTNGFNKINGVNTHPFMQILEIRKDETHEYD